MVGIGESQIHLLFGFGHLLQAGDFAGRRLSILPPRRRPAAEEQHGDRRREHQLNPPPLPLFGRLQLGRDLLPLGFHTIQFRPPRPLVGRRPEFTDRRRHPSRIGRAVIRFRAEAPLAQRHEIGVGPAGVEPRKAALDVPLRRLHSCRLGGTRGERRLPRQDDRENGPEAEHIAAEIDLADGPDRLLRRHERQGAEDAAGLRERAVRIAQRLNFRGAVGLVRVELRSLAGRQDLGQPPVHDLHFAEVADHHIRGFQVAVDHLVRVGVGDRLTNGFERGHEAPPFGGEVGAILQQLVERSALDELHRQERAAVRQRAEVVHGRDGRVLELTRDAGFVGESPGGPGRRPVLVEQDLDRHLPSEGGVGGAVDDAHAAAGDLVAQQVTIRRRRPTRA